VVSETPLLEILLPPPRIASEQDAAWTSVELSHLSLSTEKGLLGVVFANGAIALVQLGEKVRPSQSMISLIHLIFQPKTKLSGEWLSVTNATCTAFNDKHNLLAVGLTEYEGFFLSSLFLIFDLQR
jgi:hypothetical protein